MNTADDFFVAGAAFQRAFAILTERCETLAEPASVLRLRRLYHDPRERLPLSLELFKHELKVMRHEVDPGMTPERCAEIIRDRPWRRDVFA